MLAMTRPAINATTLNAQWTALALAYVLIATSGCQAVMPTGPANWLGNKPQVKESAYTAPTRMAIIWSPAVLNQAGKTPTRGFGGRVFFYDTANRPVPVEGQLVVYAYDDTRGGQGSKAADRKYAFTPDQFATHFTPSDLGASYSIWIPWDAAGGPQTHVSLVPIFTSTKGTLVMGEASPNVLPGHNTPANTPQIERYSVSPQITHQNAAGQPDHAVQQASFQQSAAQPDSSAGAGPKTLSIRLPGTMADRLTAAGPQHMPLGEPSAAQRSLQVAQSALAVQQQSALRAAAAQPASGNPSPEAGSHPAIQPGQQRAHFAPPLLPVRVAPGRPPTHGPPH
jgi:hypothetical protein